MAEPNFQHQLEFLERNGYAFEELLQNLITSRKEQELEMSTFATTLHQIAAHETSASVAKCLETLSKCGETLLVNCHDVMIQRPETEIVAILTQIQDSAIAPMKKLLEDRDKARKIETKLQKEYDELNVIHRGNAVKEKEKKLRMLADQKRRVKNVDALLETHMAHFHCYRLKKMKKLLTELARSQAFYHAKGLELFAVPCQEIAKLHIADMKNSAAQVFPADTS